MDDGSIPGPALDRLTTLVDAGRLVGFVVGLRRDGRSTVVAGGRSVEGGARMVEDAVFPLSSNTKPIGGVLALRMVELGMVGLDEPVAGLLPELADPRVLVRPGGPLDDTVPAGRAITLRDLLTMGAGFGWVPGPGPLADAMGERGIAPGPWAPTMSADEFMRRLGGLPLAAQPGHGWNYHTASDVLGVLLERATGESLATLLDEHVTGPLGLRDTGFTADPARLPTMYGAADPPGAGLKELDTADRVTTAPTFHSLACGLSSTVADQLRFLDVLHTGAPVLAPGTVRMMCTDQLAPEQRAAAQGFIGPGAGYGMQVEVRPGGAVGWTGGLGTIAYARPGTGRSAAVFTTQAVDVPGTSEALDTVWGLLS